jgi:hypothetical protein
MIESADEAVEKDGAVVHAEGWEEEWGSACDSAEADDETAEEAA